MDSPIIIRWVSQLLFLGASEVTFVFIQFVDEFPPPEKKKKKKKKIVPDGTPRSKHQMGRSVLKRPIWAYTVCICPINKTPGLHVHGLKSRPKVTMSPLNAEVDRLTEG